MAVRYFCDRCGTETGDGELRVAELALPPDPDVTLDLCPTCATDVRRHVLGDGSASSDRAAASDDAAAGDDAVPRGNRVLGGWGLRADPD
jgi:hypothetical protein